VARDSAALSTRRINRENRWRVTP